MVLDLVDEHRGLSGPGCAAGSDDGNQIAKVHGGRGVVLERELGTVPVPGEVSEGEPAVQPPVVLQIGYSGANLQLSWSAGMLLEATNVFGPWTTNFSATSPFTVITTEPQKFFRVLLP